jgi:hypothetical protein
MKTKEKKKKGGQTQKNFLLGLPSLLFVREQRLP